MVQPQPAASEISALLSSLQLGEPIRAGAAVLVPLLRSSSGSAPEIDLLEDALSAGHTRISEVSAHGDVNSVRVEHGGQRMLLLLDGEQLLGAKQNRIFNASFLVAPGTTADIPVSCVERGRWQFASPDFKASETTLTGAARAAKLHRVTTSVTTGRGYDADQGAVWRDVDAYLTKTKVTSRTSAFADGYRTKSSVVEQELEHVRPLANQIGLAVVHNGKFLCMDVFQAPALYARAWRKVVRGILGDELDAGAVSEDAKEIVSRTLTAIASAPSKRTRAPGCGEALHGSAGRVSFAAAIFGGKVIHAFAGG